MSTLAVESSVHRSPPGLAASIWAPRPQPLPISTAGWSSQPRVESAPAMSKVDTASNASHESFPDHPLYASANLTAPRVSGIQKTSLNPAHTQDVFGPVHPIHRAVANVSVKDRGTSNSPSMADTHVEQLFRTLDLNLSPDPFKQRPALPALNLSAAIPLSPSEFSPMSTSSSLLTPSDLSPIRPQYDMKSGSPYELGPIAPSPYRSAPSSNGGMAAGALNSHAALDNLSPSASSHTASTYRVANNVPPLHLSYPSTPNSSLNIFESYTDFPSPPTHLLPGASYSPIVPGRPDLAPFADQTNQLASNQPWYPNQRPLGSSNHIQGLSSQQLMSPGRHSDWYKAMTPEKQYGTIGSAAPAFSPPDDILRPSLSHSGYSSSSPSFNNSHEPINFLSLLHPSSSPPYPVFVNRIIKSSDQQASIFLQQKLKVADNEERGKIIDAICARGFEMMAHRFGNWAVQRCLEAAEAPNERRKIVACMRGKIVELATNCYGCHVLQKALDCEEDIRLLIVSELLVGDPAQTLINKHASHVWSKIMELTWTPPAPPIFAYVNKSLQGKWAALACHETGSLVVQHAFENLEDVAKEGIIDELLNQGPGVFAEVTKNQWGSYCVQHKHGSDKHKQMTVDLLLLGLLEFATHEQGSKSINKAIKEGGKEVLSRVIQRMCEPSKSARRALIVDLALSPTGSQLIASVLPSADKDQRSCLYDCIRSHIVTLRGCKTGSKVIWLFDRMRAYYGY